MIAKTIVEKMIRTGTVVNWSIFSFPYFELFSVRITHKDNKAPIANCIRIVYTGSAHSRKFIIFLLL
jgi:hypothetical protein